MIDSPDPPLLEAVGVGRRFGSTTALHEVDLTIRTGRSHALVGRNGAGKSTLVSILTGLAEPDSGRLLFHGEPAPTLSDRDGWRSRVACVYQRSTAVAHLTVAENLFVHRQPTGRFGRIDWPRMRRQARDLLEQWGVGVDVNRQMHDLGVEDRQLVEIARALSRGARFMVLDEPTAQLDKAGIERLFTRMRGLQDKGVTFLYISHHLEEVHQVCQDVTVLRDARRVVSAPVTDLPRSALVEAMTGIAEQLTESIHESHVADDSPPRLEALRMSGEGFTDVDLTVRAGEVVGLAGSSASGKTELAETLVGLRTARSGTTMVDGTPYSTGDVPHALAAGVGCVPRDRHQQGLVLHLSVAENGALTIGDRLGPAGFVRTKLLRAFGRRMITDLDIRAHGPEQAVDTLSGGNQQKVVMARAMATHPRVLVLINPTAGVDVKSKEALLGVVDTVRREGTAVVMVSDELDDLRRCDRVVVLFRGRAVTEHPAGWRDTDLVTSIEGVTT